MISKLKRCITQIKNNNLCCPRAIIKALTYHTNDIFSATWNIKDIRDDRKIQTELAKELCQRLWDYNEEGFTLEDIKNVEELLNIQVKVVCAESFNTIIYSGKKKKLKKCIYTKQATTLSSLIVWKLFLGSFYYCSKCNKPFDHKDKHKRSTNPDVCKLCAKPAHSKETKNNIYCKNCNHYCFKQGCFNNHNDICKEAHNAKIVMKL